MSASITTPKLFVCLAVLGMLVSPLMAAVPNESAVTTKIPTSVPAKDSKPSIVETDSVLDVSIQRGHLIGQIVDGNGHPLIQTKIRLLSQDETQAVETFSDTDGSFRVPIQKSGIYAIYCNGQTMTVRAWNENVAPPKTRNSLLFVNQPTTRAQGGFMSSVSNRMTPILTNPIYIGAVVATAIAIPVTLEAIDDEEDGS